MIVDQDGVEGLPEEGIIYVIVASEKDALEKNALGIYAGKVLNLEGGNVLNIANSLYLPLQEDGNLVKRGGHALYTDARAYKYFTDPELAKSAINKSVPDSDKRIENFFEMAADLQKDTETEGTETTEIETTDLGK